MLIDTHAHINFDNYNADRGEMLARAKTSGVEKIVCIGMQPDGAREAQALAKANPGFVYASAGCHPYDAALLDDACLAEFEALLKQPEFVLMGEMGVDTVKADVALDVQERAFTRQLELAIKLDKPVCIHSREAFPLSSACFAKSARRAGRVLRIVFLTAPKKRGAGASWGSLSVSQGRSRSRTPRI